MFIKISKYIPILEGFQILFEKNEPKAYYRIISISINHPIMTYGLMKKKTWEVTYLTKLLTSHFPQECN
jgi:hypothetical protein